MKNNIINTIDLLNNDYEFKDKIVKSIDIEQLIIFWLNNYNFDGEYKECKIKNYDYGFNFENNKVILYFDLYKKVEDE